jgi:flavin reductase (DIM6/NTAB) family NADH-FMN oxidoreductase RutF
MQVSRRMNIAVKPLSAVAPSLRDAMRHVAGGVSVVTVGTGAERTGLTVTSAVSLSVEVPTMLVSVNRTASAWSILQKYRHFCINFLAADQRAVADRFAGRDGVKGVARYENARWDILETGALALEGAVASIDCRVEEFIERHSHVIVLGTVEAIRVNRGEPLVYGQGRYGAFAPA